MLTDDRVAVLFPLTSVVVVLTDGRVDTLFVFVSFAVVLADDGATVLFVLDSLVVVRSIHVYPPARSPSTPSPTQQTPVLCHGDMTTMLVVMLVSMLATTS